MNATTAAEDAVSDENQTATLAVSGMIIVLAIITVILRFYVRFVTRAGIGWDDYMILLAGIVTLVTAALLVWGMFPSLTLFSRRRIMGGADGAISISQRMSSICEDC